MSELTDEEFIAWFAALNTGESLFSNETIDRICSLAGLNDEEREAVYVGATRVVDTYRLTPGQITDLLSRSQGA